MHSLQLLKIMHCAIFAHPSLTPLHTGTLNGADAANVVDGISTTYVTIGVAGGVSILLAIAIGAIIVLTCTVCLYRKSKSRRIPTDAVRWTGEDRCSIRSSSSRPTTGDCPSNCYENELYMDVNQNR